MAPGVCHLLCCGLCCQACLRAVCTHQRSSRQRCPRIHLLLIGPRRAAEDRQAQTASREKQHWMAGRTAPSPHRCTETGMEVCNAQMRAAHSPEPVSSAPQSVLPFMSRCGSFASCTAGGGVGASCSRRNSRTVSHRCHEMKCAAGTARLLQQCSSRHSIGVRDGRSASCTGRSLKAQHLRKVPPPCEGTLLTSPCSSPSVRYQSLP